MFAYCVCGYETDDYSTLKEILEQIKKDGGKCSERGKYKGKLAGCKCPKCHRRALQTD
ncbi:MAG: hypothetical protein AMQ22_00083 [Candidatus Methanofastidiosum methylothiophilum]|uniref:Uncharacterized protein n=1 Tax=Candidatus Methanofastidiosum methylothiophilum TaxID=1705564 RepID=A0A150J9E1_9EURY|nr:MAG: hypothetical protein AMQ22_00083 [Candidatus Methanofastidiosum methylthiophilus]